MRSLVVSEILTIQMFNLENVDKEALSTTFAVVPFVIHVHTQTHTHTQTHIHTHTHMETDKAMAIGEIADLLRNVSYL